MWRFLEHIGPLFPFFPRFPSPGENNRIIAMHQFWCSFYFPLYVKNGERIREGKRAGGEGRGKEGEEMVVIKGAIIETPPLYPLQ